MIRVSASLALAFALALPPIGELPRNPGESHCVLMVIGQKPSGELITAPPVCLENEGLARLWASPALAVAGAPGLEAASISALASFNLGVHYDGFNGTGSSIAIVGSTCTGGYWNTPTTWDNRISSPFTGVPHSGTTTFRQRRSVPAHDRSRDHQEPQPFEQPRRVRFLQRQLTTP